MKVQSQKTNLVPVFILGAVILVALFMLYPRKNAVAPEKLTDKPKVTVENEFSAVSSPNSVAETGTSNPSSFTFTVTSPANGATVKSAVVKVVGKTVPNADVFVNEVDAKADNGGNYSVFYTLEEGENYLIVGANDEDGNYKEMELSVTYEP